MHLLVVRVLLACTALAHIKCSPIYYGKDLYNEAAAEDAPKFVDYEQPAAEYGVREYVTEAPVPPSETSEPPYEVQHALCSLSTDQGQLAANATITRHQTGACQAKEVRKQLRLLETTLLREVRAVLREVQRLSRQTPVVFKYI